MSTGKFISLHNHTEIGSPLDAMNDVEDLILRAKEVDHPAVAITDHGTMTALYDSWKFGKKHGVKVIAGMEAYFCTDFENKKNYHLVLLAKNAVGYKNLLRLNYFSYQNQSSGYMGKKTPRLSWDLLQNNSEGIIALTACSNGLIAKTLITENNETEAITQIKRLNTIFKDNFFLELQPHKLFNVDKNGKEVNQEKLNQALVRLSHDLGVPYVITCDAHYKDKDSAKYHDFMLAVKDKKPVNDPHRFRYGVQDMYLKTHEEISDFFGSEIAEIGMKNSIDIMNNCETPDFLASKGPILPRFPVVDQNDYGSFSDWKAKSKSELADDKLYLRYKCIDAFKAKFKDDDEDKKKLYWNRVKTELSVLEEKDFASYMLIVADFINWAKENKMPVGPARGSCAGSLVAYLTGITTVDPIKYDLLFERFQNKEKKSFPDIDSDFADPDAVKDYLKQKYGKDKVASISNWSTLSPKVIVKDVARSLELGGSKSTAFEIANEITAIMPDASTIEEAMKISKEFSNYMKKYPEVHEHAVKLQGLTRNWGVHAAGVVISDQPLYEQIPLRIDAASGITVTQWEKNRCEEFGLVKMDLLGLKTLNVIDNTIELVKNLHNRVIEMDTIPEYDSEVFKMIGEGKTSGVFQLESSLTPLCMKIKPQNISEISDINALGRPSCSAEQRELYINRKNKIEGITYIDPALKNSLEKTYGVSLYEEGMMTIAKDCAGWDLNKADALRKITKLKGKDPQLVEKTMNSFIEDTSKLHGITKSKAKEIWEHEIEPFGSYGFNKSLGSTETIRIFDKNGITFEDIEIKDVKANSMVKTRDEKTKEDVLTRVVATHYHGKLKVFEITLDDGEKVKCTMNHKFRTTDGAMLPLWKIIEEGKSIVVEQKDTIAVK